MTLALTPGQSRAAALMVLAAVLAVVYGLIAAPIISAYANTNRSIADLRQLLDRYTRIAEARPQLESRMDELAANPPGDEDFLTGASDAITAAELQRVITRIVRHAEGRLISAQVLDPVVEEGLKKIALSVQFDGDIKALQQILFTIESDNPVLFIEELDVRSNRTRRIRNQEAAGPVTLRTRLDLYGYQLLDAEVGAEVDE